MFQKDGVVVKDIGKLLYRFRYLLLSIGFIVLNIIFEGVINILLAEPIALWLKNPILELNPYSKQLEIDGLFSISPLFILNTIAIIIFLCYLFSRLSIWWDIKARMRRASQRETIKDILAKLVDEFDVISSAHLYQYHISCNRSVEIITMTQIVSVVDSVTNINSIVQHIYKIPKAQYDMISLFAQDYNKNLLADRHNGFNPKTAAPAKDLCSKLRDKLMKLSKDLITEEDCCLYRCFRSLADKVNPGYPMNYYLDGQTELEDALLNKMRTGMLPGIFFDDIQWFRNTTSGFKQLRLYIVIKARFCIDEKRYDKQLLLISVEGTEDKSDCKDIAEYVCTLQEKVSKFLHGMQGRKEINE